MKINKEASQRASHLRERGSGARGTRTPDPLLANQTRSIDPSLAESNGEPLTFNNSLRQSGTVWASPNTLAPKTGSRLVRGPVPHVVEEFTLTERHGITALKYSGELGTDCQRPLGILGCLVFSGLAAISFQAGGRQFSPAVRASFASIQAEAERQARPGAANARPSVSFTWSAIFRTWRA